MFVDEFLNTNFLASNLDAIYSRSILFSLTFE